MKPHVPHVSRVDGASCFGAKMLAAAGFGLAAGTVAAGEDDTGDATFSGEPEVVNSPVANFFRAVPTAKKYFVPGFNSVSTASCAAPTPPSALSVSCSGASP